MSALVVFFAIIGAVAVVVLLGLMLAPAKPEPEPEEDLAAPYREGLHAAVRMQHVARDLEQQIYAEAAGHMGDQGAESPPAP